MGKINKLHPWDDKEVIVDKLNEIIEYLNDPR